MKPTRPTRPTGDGIVLEPLPDLNAMFESERSARQASLHDFDIVAGRAGAMKRQDSAALKQRVMAA